MATELLGIWNSKGEHVAADQSFRDGKPLLTRHGGRWQYIRTYVESWKDRNGAASVWCDRRNYFAGIRAGIALGRALDCRSRGCPVSDDEREARSYGPFN